MGRLLLWPPPLSSVTCQRSSGDPICFLSLLHMDPSASRGVLRGPEMEVDAAAYDYAAEAGSSSGAEDFSSGSGEGGGEWSDVESMTGRGIKCLCSELLELKKSSDEDFQKNVYSRYSTFISVFKEVGDVRSELMELKGHVLDQKRLGKELMETFFMDDFSDYLLELKVENDLEIGDHLLSKLQTHSASILEKLEILSLDQQFEEALDILETEKKTLQKISMQGDLISEENFASRRSALSDWRIRLADQLTFMAGHPRITAPELQKLLLLLCRLGENSRANSLLIQFYHSQLEKRLHDLQCSESLLSQFYMMELAKITFSVISQAARSSVMLYGETSAYGSEFILWVTEEIKMFAHYFNMHIKSFCEMNEGLHVAVESLKCALSFCSLLKSQRLVLHPCLIKSIRPCMEEVLQIHVDYLRQTVRIFTPTDTWILGKFLVSGITGDTSYLVGDGGKLEYYLLTSSGRMFVTLIEAILEDISPLCDLQMESSILNGLAHLFIEYINILECSIPRYGNSVKESPPRVSSAQKLSQQLALLVNTWNLVDYLCSIAECISEAKACNDKQIPDMYEAFTRKELDSWIFSIQDAADQLGGFFCQQFVNRYISATAESTRTSLESYMILGLAVSAEAPMPSTEFQILFQQLRQLEKYGKLVFSGADERVEKLLEDLMGSLVATIANNMKLRRDNEHSFPIQQSIWFKQFVLDMYFLVEIAKFRGCLSDRLMEASTSLAANMENACLDSDLETSLVTDDAWASSAAQAAIQKLVEMEATKVEPDENHVNASEEDFDYERTEASGVHDLSEPIELSDGEVETSAQTDARPQIGEESTPKFSDGTVIDFTSGVTDDNYYMSPSTAYIDVHDVPTVPPVEPCINQQDLPTC